MICYHRLASQLLCSDVLRTGGSSQTGSDGYDSWSVSSADTTSGIVPQLPTFVASLNASTYPSFLSRRPLHARGSRGPYAH